MAMLSGLSARQLAYGRVSFYYQEVIPSNNYFTLTSQLFGTIGYGGEVEHRIW